MSPPPCARRSTKTGYLRPRRSGRGLFADAHPPDFRPTFDVAPIELPRAFGLEFVIERLRIVVVDQQHRRARLQLGEGPVDPLMLLPRWQRSHVQRRRERLGHDGTPSRGGLSRRDRTAAGFRLPPALPAACDADHQGTPHSSPPRSENTRSSRRWSIGALVTSAKRRLK